MIRLYIERERERGSMPALSGCQNITELGALARRRLPLPVSAILFGGAEDEVTLHRNTRALDDIAIIPKALVDVAHVQTETTLFGIQTKSPFFCSPTGLSRLFHPEGELAVARAAARKGLFYGLSANSTHSLEAVNTASDGPKLFQLLPLRDRGLMRALIERCRASGYHALGLTIDAPTRGNCEGDVRGGLGRGLTPANLVRFAMHPRWSIGQVQHGRLTIPIAVDATNVRDFADNSRFVGAQLDPGFSWKDVEDIVTLWKGPFALKGVLAPDDAKRALDVGATSIIVSNHGGRQLDGAAAAITCLPGVVAAVAGRAEIILDGGIRRGSHILKALALGAHGVSIGRAYLYGLAAGGEQGVLHALSILQQEFERAMRLSGCATLADISRDLVRIP